jgi:tRNA(adenine34) deaminase
MEINHEKFIEEAYKLAQSAADGGDVPVGAVVVYEGEIIGRGENRRQRTGDPSAHAEILALKQASEHLGSWNLSGCSLYVTLEPCPMCAGAVIVSRIDNVYFGAYDRELGCCGTLYNLPEDERMNHRANVYGGILEEKCAKILSDFFKDKR